MAEQNLQRTLIIIKPDGVQRGLIGGIIGRFEAADFRVIGLRCVELTEDLAQEFYREHVGKDFFESLIAFMTSGPVVLLGLERDDAIARARQLVGKTNPLEAAPGTIRADCGVNGQRNTVHASDSPESAARELGLMLAELLD